MMEQISEKEQKRRRRVVHGWAFKTLPLEKRQEIRRYLAGGPVPSGYENLHEVVK